MIQLVAVDMDGTLLKNDSTISLKNANAIKKAYALGVKFVINTGRGYQNASNILAPTGINCDFICLSGAATYNGGVCTNEYMLSDQSVRTIINLLKKYNLYDEIMTDKGNYTTAPKEEIYNNVINNVIPAIESLGKSVSHISEYIEKIVSGTNSVPDIDTLLTKDLKIYKITSTSLNKNALNLVREALLDRSDLAIASSFPVNIELTAGNAKKGLALARYAEEHQIPFGEIMAIGDSENDYSMLSMDFGYTVAMGNADENIKKICKYQTLSNENDGIAYILEKMLLC